jgi:general stress protein 26
MSKRDPVDRVWDIIQNVGVCMLTTQFGDGLRARPLEARPDRDAGVIFFVTDLHSPKEDEIQAAPDVGLVFIDSSANAYLSITARASVMRDPDKTRAVWRKTDEVWWPGGPTDPDVSLLRVEPFTAELWDGPASSAVAAFEFAKARLTGEKPNLGENRKVTVKM